ncbi:MAG: hypothetical protein R3264_03480 [Anaerolineae bacterium]|nr:hypothetical protein [Anaerolineae bacterium]
MSGLVILCLVCGLVTVGFILIDPSGVTTEDIASSLSLSDPIDTSEPAALSQPLSTVALGTPLPTATVTPTPTPLPTPTITSTPPGSTPVAVESAAGWSFEGVRIQPDPDLGGLTIYGEAINGSGAAQSILGLQSTIYDLQGQEIPKEIIDDYWPIETVPDGGRIPFELTLLGPSQADRVELQIVTEPGNQPPRTDFELFDLEGADVETEFCVTGRARNLGQPLDSYLIAVAVLYDQDERVINWGLGYQSAPADLTGEATVVVSACAERFNNVVARYELRAWGE